MPVMEGLARGEGAVLSSHFREVPLPILWRKWLLFNNLQHWHSSKNHHSK
jgi:hypothetical protein